MNTRLYILLGFLLGSGLTGSAETRVVCNSTSETLHTGAPCVYTSVQTAINAAGAGDLILLKAGQTFDSFVVPNGKHDLVIKSSRIDEWSSGYRITRNNPRLARIETSNVSTTPIRIGEDFKFHTVTPGSTTLTHSVNTGYAIGDEVTLTGTYLTPYYCRQAIAALYVSGQCTAANYEKWMVRYDPVFRDGAKLYVFGGLENLNTTGLTAGQAYQVRDFVYASGYASFNLAPVSGGAPIVPSETYVPLTGMMLEYGPAPHRNDSRMYVVAKSASAPWTIQLSPTRGGTPWTWPQVPAAYNGSATVTGVQLWRSNSPREITIDGLEVVASDSIDDPYSLVWIFPGKEASTAASGISIRRCWIHGHDDQQSYPIVGIYMSGYRSEVRDSIIEQIYSRDQDSQAVAIANSPGDVLLENNYLSATGMSMMSGGSFPNYMGRIREQMTLRRNYATKPRKWFTSIQTSRVDANNVKLASAATGNTCGTEAANTDLAKRCAYHFGDENGARYEVGLNTTITYTGGSGTGFGYLYGMDDGQLYFRHNLTDGVFTCPSHVNCAYSVTPTIPPGAPRLGKVMITAGTINATTSFGEARLANTKNLFESKEGNKWLIEGNVMENAFVSITNGGGIQQAMCINATVAPTGSGNGAANYLASSLEWTIRYNICRRVGEGFLFNGKAFDPNRREIHGIGASGAALIENNLLYNIGSHLNTPGSIGTALRGNNVQHIRFQHNTVIDVRQVGSFNSTTPLCCGAKYLNVDGNVFVPWLGADQTGGILELPQVNGDGYVDWIQGTGPGYYGIDKTNSRMGRNVLMNRNSNSSRNTRGVHYPAAPDTTYCVQSNDACRTGTDLFTTFVERNYSASNYRIAKPYTMYPTYTDRLIGADIDEIESLTGKDGVDVVAGAPPFYVRSRRVVKPGSTSAVLSYRPLSQSGCTISLWSFNTYQSGNVLNAVSDSTATVLDGRRVMQLTGLAASTTYYGKRWCDADVDVFEFTTLPQMSPTTIGLSAPAGSAYVVLEWGASAALGNVSPATPCMAGSVCSIPVPSTALYYRHSFRNASGVVVAVSDVQGIPSE